jgi:hypothetical protein
VTRRRSAAAAFVVLAFARPSFADGSSLDAMIDHAASRAGVERRIQAVGGLVAGAALTVGGWAALDGTPSSDASGRAGAYALLGAGIITLGSAPFALLGSDPVERFADDVRSLPGGANDPQRLHRIDVMLEHAANEERAARDAGAWTSGFISAAFFGFALNEALSETDSPTSRMVRATAYGAGAAASATRALLLAKTPGALGILAENWSVARGASSQAPAAPPLALAVVPMGLGLSVSGAF